MKATKPQLHDSGFTLIELLVVVAIILILVAIALPNFLEAMVRAKVTKAKGDIRTIITALNAYFNDWGNFPENYFGKAPRGSGEGLERLVSPIEYLKDLPSDPFAKELVDGNRAFEYMGGSGSVALARKPCYPHSTTGFCGCGYLDDPAYPYANRGCIHAYVVVSWGPFESSAHDWLVFPYDINDPLDRPKLTSYSPTNGVRSYGGIASFTGEWRRGYFELDGQIVGRP